MASNIPSPSWAAIIRPTEVHFCPVTSGSNRLPLNLDRKALEEVIQLLGEELAHFINCDPQIHATIWQHKRIEVRWPENRPEIRQKIIRCLHQANIIMVGVKGKDEEVITHRLSEAACSLYEKGTPLTRQILELLAAKGKDADGFTSRISYLNKMGLSPDQIGTLFSGNREEFEAAIVIIEQFHRTGFKLTQAGFDQLIKSKSHFKNIYCVASALERTSVPLTKEICEELLKNGEYAKQLAYGISILDALDFSKREMHQFLLEKAETGQLYLTIETLMELNQFGYFQTDRNARLLIANQAYLGVIKSAIDAVHQADIPVTRKFCELLITLIKYLRPFDKADFLFLAVNAKHSSVIQSAFKDLNDVGFPFTKEILLFLVSQEEKAWKIGWNAQKILQTLAQAKIANIQLQLDDIILLMKNSEHAGAIANTIEYLHDHSIPFLRVDFPLLVANGAQATNIKLAIRHLLLKDVTVTHEILFRFLNDGTDVAAINRIIHTVHGHHPNSQYNYL